MTPRQGGGKAAGTVIGIEGISKTLRAGDNFKIAENPKCNDEWGVIQVGNLKDDANRTFKNPQQGRVYSKQGISPTITTCQVVDLSGGGHIPKILEYE